MTPAPRSTVSVVVPTWSLDRRDGLAACLQAIGRQTLPPNEVIVVVDKNPELLTWVRSSFPTAKAVSNRFDRGVVGARNSGIEIARGDIVVLTDDDTRAEERWLESLEACFSDPSVVGVTGELIPSWAGARPRWFPPELYWVLGCSYEGLPREVAPVRNPIAANMAVRTRALQEAGGFRQGARPREIAHRGSVIAGGHALEDTELGIRVGRRWPEMRWLYQPAAVVHHTVTPAQASLGYLMRRSFEEGAGKAQLARVIGARDGLSAERRYVSVVLPRGMALGAWQSLRGDRFGALRSAVIAIGLLASGLGFLAGFLARPRRPTR